MGKSAHSELCAPTAPGALLCRHMHPVFPVGAEGNALNQSVNLGWVATVEKIKHASLRHNYSVEIVRICVA